MAKKKSLLKQMKANPRADWDIGDVIKLCEQVGLVATPPSRGSHYKIHSSLVDGILTVPARRPIKAVYIRSFVGLVEAHIEYSRNEEGGQ